MQEQVSAPTPLNLEMLLLFAVLFLGVLYWGFRPGRGRRGPEKNNPPENGPGPGPGSGNGSGNGNGESGPGS